MPPVLSRRMFAAAAIPASMLGSGAVAAKAPDRSLGRHAFLMSGEWDHRNAQQTLYVVRGGRLHWSFALPADQAIELGDASMLANGNILFAYKSGAGEVTPDRQIVWRVDAQNGTEIHTLQPLDENHVMVMQNGNPAMLMIIRKSDNAVEKTINLSVPNPDKPHIQFRRVRVTGAGTYMAGHLDDHKIVEYDQDGKALWTHYIDRPWGVWPLAGGKVLVSCYNDLGASEVVEITRAGDVVWRFSQADVPNTPCFQFQGVSRLRNGNTLICNWCAGDLKDTAQWSDTVQVFEVTRDKRVVWTLRSWNKPDLGTASSIQLLDQPDGYGISS